jgi:hypothetical protein
MRCRGLVLIIFERTFFCLFFRLRKMLPSYYPFTIDLEFPEDWHADVITRLLVFDESHHQSVLCQIVVPEEARDRIALLDDPDGVFMFMCGVCVCVCDRVCVQTHEVPHTLCAHAETQHSNTHAQHTHTQKHIHATRTTHTTHIRKHTHRHVASRHVCRIRQSIP